MFYQYLLRSELANFVCLWLFDRVSGRPDLKVVPLWDKLAYLQASINQSNLHRIHINYRSNMAR